MGAAARCRLVQPCHTTVWFSAHEITRLHGFVSMVLPASFNFFGHKKLFSANFDDAIECMRQEKNNETLK
jgi:hypothetical protein